MRRSGATRRRWVGRLLLRPRSTEQRREVRACEPSADPTARRVQVKRASWASDLGDMSDAGRGDAPGSRAYRWTTKAIRAQGASSPGRGIAIVAVLLGLSWLVSYVLGGAGRVPPHWFYVPILLAAARFGLPGAAATAVVAGLVAGPLLPLDVATGTRQHFLDWSARLGFFLGIGLGKAETSLFERARPRCVPCSPPLPT